MWQRTQTGATSGNQQATTGAGGRRRLGRGCRLCGGGGVGWGQSVVPLSGGREQKKTTPGRVPKRKLSPSTRHSLGPSMSACTSATLSSLTMTCGWRGWRLSGRAQNSAPPFARARSPCLSPRHRHPPLTRIPSSGLSCSSFSSRATRLRPSADSACWFWVWVSVAVPEGASSGRAEGACPGAGGVGRGGQGSP